MFEVEDFLLLCNTRFLGKTSREPSRATIKVEKLRMSWPTTIHIPQIIQRV